MPSLRRCIALRSRCACGLLSDVKPQGRQGKVRFVIKCPKGSAGDRDIHIAIGAALNIVLTPALVHNLSVNRAAASAVIPYPMLIYGLCYTNAVSPIGKPRRLRKRRQLLERS